MDLLESLVVDIPEDINNLVVYGDYEHAMELIDIYMKRNIPTILKKRLEFEKDRIKRLKSEYIYTFEEAFELASKKVKNFTREELNYLKDERFADWAYIDGTLKFHKRFFENTLKVHPTMKDRLFEKENAEIEILDKTVNEIIENGEKKYYIHVKTGIKLNKGCGNIGETVRVHLPIPQNAQQIENIKIINTSYEPKYISPEDYPQRTIYFEEKVTGEDIFTVEYSYENHIKYNKLDPDKVSSVQPNFCTEEWLPHVRFTPFLVELTKEIVENEPNPLLKARKIYDYITKNIQYSFVRPYATITNIPEYAAYNLKGDCGVQAILFITLCRIAKIPARWQSGLYVTPYSIGCHDWAQFYIEPYGWLFADPSFGGGAYRNGVEKRWNFYFGNLDPFRMVANSEFQYTYLPEKKFLCADPYDNQVGEVEFLDRGIYGDQYQSIMKIIDVHEI